MTVQCSHGGPAPCVDDLCHGSDTTLCGLQRGYDFCDHGEYPDFCKECAEEDDDCFFDDYPLSPNAITSLPDPTGESA